MSSEAAVRDQAVAALTRLRQLANPGLLRPFLEAKVQATFPRDKPTKAILVVYVDARAVASILDRVIGPEAWSFQLLQSPMHTDQGWTAHGRLTLHGFIDIHREDLGTGSGNAEMGGKGAASDALKRCAAQLGVGRALYALEPITAPCDERKRVAALEMRKAIEAWRAQLAKWAQAFDAGDAGAEAPPAPPENQMPAEGMPSAPPAPGGGGAPPARGRPGGAPASGAPRPRASSGGADAGDQGPAETERPSAGPARSSAEHPEHKLHPLWRAFHDYGLRWTPSWRDQAVEALRRDGIEGADALREREDEMRAIVRRVFAVKPRAEVQVPVPSKSREGEHHTVRLARYGDDVGVECSCEAYAFNAVCPHIQPAWLQLGLSWLTDAPPSPEQAWDGIDVAAQAEAAQAQYELAFPDAAARRRPAGGDEEAAR